MRIPLITCCFLLLSAFGAAGHGGSGSQPVLIENRGQWPDQVLYGASMQGVKLFLEKEGFTYHCFDLEGMSSVHNGSLPPEPGQARFRGHVFHVKLLGCNASATTKPEERQICYYNYFLGNDPGHWASACPSYSAVNRSNLYPGIDQRLYFSNAQPKYDLVVHPGANPADVRMKYSGMDGLRIENGRLVVVTSIGEMWEQPPIAWQENHGIRSYVECRYTLNGDELGFEFPSGYDKENTLVIDPELIFSTYSGSYTDNFGYTATYDTDGYLYSGSSAFGNQYPVTTGAYQVSWAGGDGQGNLPGIDMALSKYDITGTYMVWSSYLGGSHDELPHSLICNNDNELYVYGTTSSQNFPVTVGAFSTLYSGGIAFAPSGVGADYVNGSDIVLSHFSSDGSDLLGSTFLGGSGNDGVNTAATLKFNYADEFRGEIDFDKNGNVVVASSTYSSDFPIVGGFQATLSGGQEGCLVKMSSDLSNILWSSFIGGSNNDSGYSVAFDSANNIYFCGGTRSPNFPVDDPNAIQTVFAGDTDGWVIKVSEDGTTVLASTLYGSNQYDQIYFVETDSEDHVHVYGQTLADDDFFILNAGYNVPNSGMLVAKFSPDLDEVIWSTVFGTGEGEPNLSPTAFLVDVCGKIYMSGWGGSTNTNSNPLTDNLIGMTATSDAYQQTTTGSDFYFLVIEADASALVYASFFGGNTSAEHVDGGTSRFDRKGIMYQSVCAGCGSNDDFPIYPANAWSPTNNSNNCNNGVFKFDFQLPLTAADFLVPPTGCVNSPVQFTNTSTWAATFDWDFGDDSPANNQQNPIHVYDEPGIYEITLIVTHPNTCNAADTVVKEIEITFPSVSDLGSTQVCGNESVLIGPDSPDLSYSYLWQPASYLSDNGIANPLFTPGTTTDYTCLVIHGGCVDTLYQSVNVTSMALSIPGDTTLCDDQVLVLAATYSPGNSEIIWSVMPDFSIPLNDNISDPDIEVNPTIPTTYYVQINLGDCAMEGSVFVNLVSFQTMVEGDLTVCEDDTTQLSVLDPNPEFSYSWAPASLILDGQNTPSVSVIVPEDTYFIVYSETPDGCTASDTVLVTVSDLTSGSISASADPSIILEGQSSQLDVTPDGYEYTWSPPNWISNIHSQEPIVTPPTTTVYYVVVSDGECIYGDSVVVRVVDWVCGPPSIYVPNAFTPNRDDRNENLFVRANFITKLYFVIYDRWGEKVFETESLDKGWDGTFRDRELDPDVYVYYLEATCDGGGTYFDKGNITLIR